MRKNGGSCPGSPNVTPCHREVAKRLHEEGSSTNTQDDNVDMRGSTGGITQVLRSASQCPHEALKDGTQGRLNLVCLKSSLFLWGAASPRQGVWMCRQCGTNRSEC
eukprot:262464-Amphidinium_carterae.1